MPSQRDARRELEALITQYQNDKNKDRLTESDVIQKYIEPLLGDVLGWPLRDSDRYLRELHTVAGRPDLRLTAENNEIIYVEAKKFGVINKLEDIERETTNGEIRRESETLKRSMTDVLGPGQLALPGLAVDRTQEEQQAINYAFKNNGKWAILTNFERLRLFNARRDWLVLSFESPGAFLDDFDLLWQLSYEEIVGGSLDYLSNQRYTEDVDKQYLKLINHWRQALANDIIAMRDSNPWAFDDNGEIDLPRVRSVVQRVIDRLVIIRFAEDHLVIPPGTLYSTYELQSNNPYTFSMDEFIDRFFRRFDHYHNSALFAPGDADKASFSDETLRHLVRDLYFAKYRAMPADILGNTYEQYLGETLTIDEGEITTRDNLETRKKQGSYYTPQVIVRYIVDNSLGRYLYGTENGQSDGAPLPDEPRKTSRNIRELRVLDSACGSGSFLIYAYYVLAGFYESEIQRLEDKASETIQRLSAQEYDRLDIELELAPIRAEIERIRNYPRLILETHLYGVDLDPQAAEIAVVNLMMRAMERQGTDKRLPLILNQNVKVGNALIGLRPDDERLQQHSDALADLRQLRLELVATPNTDPAHDRIVDKMEAATAALYAEFEADFADHFTSLERIRPFHWSIEFPEVFYDANGAPRENPGFDVIIGNPPWEIVKPDLREFYAQFDEDIESRMTRKQVDKRIEELNAEDLTRTARWQQQRRGIEESATYFKDSDTYTRQGRGDTATHKLFMERAYAHLLADSGRLGYVVPSGIYTDLGTKELREMLLYEGHIQYLYSFSNERWFFPGVHHAFKFALIGAQKDIKSEGFWATFRFNPRVAVAPDELEDFLSDEENLIYVQTNSIEKFNPDSLVVMEFENSEQYRIAEKLYQYAPLGKSSEELWDLEFAREFDMSNDSDLFNQQKRGLPLYEGKMIHQFDAFFAEPRYWIEEETGTERNSGRHYEDWYKDYKFAFREVAGATNERTCISTILPKRVFAGHTLWVGVAPDYQKMLWYTGVLNSLCVDWAARFSVNFHVTLTIMKSLPLPRLTDGNPYFDAIVPRAARLTCTTDDFADLWQAVMGEPWNAADTVTDDDARQRLRDEIDALVAHLYDLSRDEFDHILGTFPLVFADDETGQQRREQLLTVYDEWASQVEGWSRR